MEKAPERIWLTAKRGQIEEANGRPVAGPKQGNQVRDDAGATNLARFQGDTVDVLAAADRRSPLGGKSGHDQRAWRADSVHRRQQLFPGVTTERGIDLLVDPWRSAINST